MNDAESLQQPRGRWPYRCIVASIALLYLLFLGAAVWMLIFYEVRREQTPRNAGGSAEQPARVQSEARTAQGPRVFYLTPKSAEVKNKTMSWQPSVAETYEEDKRAFRVPRKGSYLLGLALVLRCDSPSTCSSGSLHLSFSSNSPTGSREGCRMNLETDPPPCIHMLDMPADARLLVNMAVKVQEGANDWRLDTSRSKWWIFLTD